MARLLHWNIDECAPYFDRMKVRGWCGSHELPITKIVLEFRESRTQVNLTSYGLPSADVAEHLGPSFGKVRFDEWVALSDSDRGQDFRLVCHFENGEICHTDSAHSKCREGDPGHRCWYRYLNMLGEYAPGNVLEIGSRARSGVVRKQLIPGQHKYFGIDINAGPNVDYVGDAHELARHMGDMRFVGVMALAVFEHLAMPWKVVLEMNEVMEQGGLAYISCQQAWPVHEEPCDYWRYSKYAWQWLFNEYTGFEIVETAHGEPARIHPLWDSPVVRDMHLSTAYLNSSVIARKIKNTTLRWDVPVGKISMAQYTDALTKITGL